MDDDWGSLRGDWSGWRTTTDRDWVHYAAPGDDLPDQGWKLHLSARRADADTVLRLAAAVCLNEGRSFKHLRDRAVLERANEKDAPRASSGKFVTMYPRADEVTEAFLGRMTNTFGGCRGPRILGDLQWRGSVVHLRYGAFRLMHTWDGHPAVRRPGGRLEPDRRGVVFDVPEWVRVPDWMTAERSQVDDANELGQLVIDGAFSFSNSGGVYRGMHEEHGAVVVKEGRELVAERAGRDAADRIEEEHARLRSLRGTGSAPRTFGSFRSAGSAFAVIEMVPGIPFNRAVMSRNPLTASAPARDALDAHEDDVSETIEAVLREAQRLHVAGVVHGDLSPRNVLVGTSRTVRLVDFESSAVGTTSGGTGPATPGFTAPSAVEGPERDLFAVACLHVAALVPLTSLFPLDPGKIGEVLSAVKSWFPTAPVDRLRSVFERCVTAQGADTARATLPSASEIADALVLRAGPSHETNAGIEHGTDGRLLAIRRHFGGTRTVPGHSTAASGVGLFSGLASAALLGSTDPVVASAVRESAHVMERVDLEGGLAGIGVALLCAPVRSAHRETIQLIADRLSEFSHESDRPKRLAPGLRNGPSGIALFLALHGRLHGDDLAAEAARRILDLDLRRLEHRAGTGLQLVRDGRLVPFLGSGSAGVGVALVQLVRATSDEDLLPTLTGVVDAATPVFSAHAGLLDGRAGLVHFLVDAGELDRPSNHRADFLAHLHEHRKRFALHRLHTADGIAYPDQQLRDVDDGWGHGAAGVLSALTAIDEFGEERTDPDGLPSFLRGASR